MNNSKIKPGQMVHAKGQGEMGGAQGKHIGTVDHLDGDHYIKLTKKDSRDGKHHWIPVNWVKTVDETTVYLDKTEDRVYAEMFDKFPEEGMKEAV